MHYFDTYWLPLWIALGIVVIMTVLLFYGLYKLLRGKWSLTRSCLVFGISALGFSLANWWILNSYPEIRTHDTGNILETYMWVGLLSGIFSLLTAIMLYRQPDE